MTDSSSALIVRLDALGDTLALAPLLLALREAAVPTDIVVAPAARELFVRGALRHTYVAPFAQRDESVANRDAIRSFAEELRPNRYSHVLVATEDPAGYRLAAALAAPHRIGFQNGWGKPLKSLWVRSLLTETQYRSAGLDARAPHECEVLFSLGASLLAPGVRPSRDPARLRSLILEPRVAASHRVALQLTSKWERLGIAHEFHRCEPDEQADTAKGRTQPILRLFRLPRDIPETPDDAPPGEFGEGNEILARKHSSA